MQPAPTPPVSMVAQLALARIDYPVRNRTDGVFDFRSAIAVFLIAAALFQAARGRLVGPATTLLMSALAMIEASSRRQE